MFLFLAFIIITTLHGASRCQHLPRIDEHLAKTCQEMFNNTWDARDGFYWINPSQGDMKKAIFVHCVFKTRETCIYTKSARRLKIFDISAFESEVWLVKNDSSYEIAYRADANQLRMLQQMSKSATQAITYRCKNSIVYYDSINKNFEKSMKLLGWNNEEITPQNLSNLQFMSGHDNCQHKNDEWSHTDITYSTNIPSQLPITDIAIRDVGRPGQLLEVHIGPVCFL
ncbi:collagen alpha-2(I) chain-like [Planococcus citri]|uniref:collagen alpha-2(I) chain-like n=1 Tax=Planococcus citri TaxID=170843 RepID=UPI0031FA2AA5